MQSVTCVILLHGYILFPLDEAGIHDVLEELFRFQNVLNALQHVLTQAIEHVPQSLRSITPPLTQLFDVFFHVWMLVCASSHVQVNERINSF